MDDFLENFFRAGKNYSGTGEPEDYYASHDENGNYIPPEKRRIGDGLYTQMPQCSPLPQQQSNRPSAAELRTERELGSSRSFSGFDTAQAPAGPRVTPLPRDDNFISPRTYQNIVLYSPRTAADVERLIDYLKRREPAIINLEPIASSPDAQRVLDITSGATYALGGTIEVIGTNMFLIVPDGIEISKSDKHD